MAITVDEWNALFAGALDNPTDSAGVISALTRARDEYATIWAEHEGLMKARDELTTEVDRLKQTNMELFLRIGKEVSQATGSPDGEAHPDPELARAETIKIADLFKE